MLRGFVLAIMLFGGARVVAAQQSAPPASREAQPSPHARHHISVTFDWDFDKTPPCSPTKPTHPCVDRFAMYETTAGTSKQHRIFLFYVPLPEKQTGFVPIEFQGPKQFDFVLGWHKLSVVTLDDIGNESEMMSCDSCATWVYIQTGPTLTPSKPVPGTSSAPPPEPPPTSAPSAP